MFCGWRRRGRVGGVGLWGGTALCLMLVGAWCASGFVSICWYRMSDGRYIGLRRGVWFVYWREGLLTQPVPQPGWTITRRLGPEWRTRWFPRIQTWPLAPGSITRTTIPVWFSLAIVACLTTFLWYRDRRPPRGHCQACGYSLTGNVSGVCPECGAAIKSPQETPSARTTATERQRRRSSCS